MRDPNKGVPLDVQRMCKQAEYEHETWKLERLRERLQRQLGQGEHEKIKPGLPKPPVSEISSQGSGVRGRLSFFER